MKFFRLILLSTLLCSIIDAKINVDVAFPGLSFSRPVDLQHAGLGK